MRFPRVVPVIVVYGHLSIAAPQILFPINSQVPPVARASIPFTFTFAPSTFSTDLPNTYTLSNAPGWLSLDSKTRTLSGTPTPGDADLNISITASDDTGSVTMNSELVVRTEPAPIVQIPLESQLSSFGASSAPSTVLYYSSSHFGINFSPKTFAENGGSSTLNYYAVSQNRTPLPAWVSFDANSLTFSGQTPDYHSLVQPPQTFGILLIASDVEGFAGTSIAFNIAVGNHRLAFNNTTISVRGEGRKLFQYEGLSDSLELDGQVISATDLASITAQTPGWLNFDNSTFVLMGTPPTDAPSCNVTITAVDFYGDTASALLKIDFSTALFSQNVTQLNATIGQYFSYDFTSDLVNSSDVATTAQFEPDTSWLSFDPANNTISGLVPTGIPPSTVRITLQASSKSSPDTESISVILNVVSHMLPPTSSITSLLTSVIRASSTSTITSTMKHEPTTSSATHLASGDNKDYKRKLSKGEIAAVVVPLVLLVMAVVSCIFWLGCCRRKRRGDGAKSPSKSDISGPLPIISPSYVKQIGASRQTLPRQRPRKSQITRPKSVLLKQGAQRSRQSNSSPIRKSQTISDFSGTRSSHLTESNNSGNRGRSYSENALSSRSSGWRTESTDYSRRTQDSAYPPLVPRPNSARVTRNFSRKKGSEQLQRDDTSPNVFLYRGPSTKSRNSSIQQTPDSIVYTPRKKSRARNPGILVHKEDEDEFESEHSGGPLGQSGLSRSTSSWLTDRSVGGDRVQNRESIFSAQTQDTGLLSDSNYINKNEDRGRIRMVPPSPRSPPSPPKVHLDTIEASPRIGYTPKRSTGGGGFFLGGSRSSSRTHRSPSLRSGYAASFRTYSNTNSPALPAPIPEKFNETSLASFTTTTTANQPVLSPTPLAIHKSTIERMVSAAGLRSQSETPTIGIGIGHGRIIGGNSNDSSQRNSFLSNISNRLSRTFQRRNSNQDIRGNETDTESQFQAAEEDQTPQRSPLRHQQRDSQLHTAFRSLNEGEYSEDDYDEESRENSIVEEYVRNSLANSYKNARSSFTPRMSKGVPIEYSQDEESPTLGQGTLGEIQKIVVTGRTSRDSGLRDHGERVPNSPMVLALRGRVEAMRERVGQGPGPARQGLGLGLALRDDEGRILGGRGKRPVSIEVGGNRHGGGLGIHSRKTSVSARRYEYADDENVVGNSAFL